ncbi:MAG: hypothetical protein N3A65_02850 [candidate division WOR-3 bacterium]|nr:hypothetical protein [candidate division WOR-3 bacterium]
MAKFDKILCPYCLFTSRYVDLIINQDGDYICPQCDSTFFYEEIMQLYGLSNIFIDNRLKGQEPFTL